MVRCFAVLSTLDEMNQFGVCFDQLPRTTDSLMHGISEVGLPTSVSPFQSTLIPGIIPEYLNTKNFRTPYGLN